MAIFGNTVMASAPAQPVWLRALLGVALIVAGMFVLGDVALATIVSVKLIGLAVIFAGVFELLHAFWTKGWGGMLWQIMLGLLYTALGFVLLYRPVVGALVLTYLLGALLFATGIFRSALGVVRWRENGWMMLLSGIFGLLAGLLILFGFPANSLWVLGILIGVDLISHGVAWLLYSVRPVARTTARPA
jgi:uncharacterized membrane protein HdeD (DUF308 family)